MSCGICNAEVQNEDTVCKECGAVKLKFYMDRYTSEKEVV